MKFSKPSGFNDPYDCCPTHFAELLNEPSKNQLPHAVTDNMNRGIQEATSALVGVACLTPHPDRMLMWSHYGDQHRGVCVGFDTEILLNNCQLNSEENPIYTEVRKVIYTTNRSDENDLDYIFKKSEEWSSEDEYRIVSIVKAGNPQWGPGVWKIPKEAIKEIVIGARIEPGLRKDIVENLKLHGPDILRKQAVLHTHTFELIIENLDDQPSVAPMSGPILGPNGNWM